MEGVTEEKVEKEIEKFVPNPVFQSALAIMPKNFKDLMEMAAAVSKSMLLPRDLQNNAGGCMSVIMYGMELGIPPIQAMQNITPINGRLTMWGDLVLALAHGSNQIESFEEDAPDLALKQGFGRCTVKATGQTNPVTRTFSLEDAKRAGLMTKDNWLKYPGRMLQMRARSWALRDSVPHVLKGIAIREEAEDYEYSINTAPVKMPEPRKSEKTAPVVQEAEIVNPSEIEQKQEPVADVLVDDADRKELFRMRSEAGINLQDTKDFMKQTFGVEDTAKLTKNQAEKLKVWFVKNARK